MTPYARRQYLRRLALPNHTGSPMRDSISRQSAIAWCVAFVIAIAMAVAVVVINS